MSKEKQLQIPESLMLDILKFHICGIRDSEIEKRIQDGLNTKLAAMQARQEYQENLSRLKTKKSFRDTEHIVKEKKQSVNSESTYGARSTHFNTR